MQSTDEPMHCAHGTKINDPCMDCIRAEQSTDSPIPERCSNQTTGSDVYEDCRMLAEELGTAESLLREVTRALQACVKDLEIAQAEICEFAPSVKSAKELLSRIPKELRDAG